MEKLREFFSSPNLWLSVGIIAASIIVWVIFSRCFKSVMKKGNLQERKEANVRLIVAIVKYLVGVFLVIVVLQINGVNVTSLVTGLGIASVTVAFAIQDLLKDLIMGTNIIWNGFFKVGDVVRYRDIEGKIIFFNIKSTRISDIKTGNILTVCNRNISEIEIISDWLDIDIPAPYEEDCEHMREICSDICKSIKTLSDVSDCVFLGTEGFADSFVNYRIRIHCIPEKRHEVRWVALGLIQDVYKNNGLSVPYPQTDVHIIQQQAEYNPLNNRQNADKQTNTDFISNR